MEDAGGALDGCRTVVLAMKPVSDSQSAETTTTELG